MNTFEKMDRMYRLQRYFYDITRKYYLLGRDRLLSELAPLPGERIVEVGCGTARNLIILARRHPQTKFFGLDASAAMLETARANIARTNIKNITLKTGLADDFAFDAAFLQSTRFDKAFFSYSLSMIPSWRRSIKNALENLRPGGELFIVDFYDQKELPPSFQRLLKWWLSKFGVRYWEELLPFLRSLESAGRGRLTISPIHRRYSFIAKFEIADN